MYGKELVLDLVDCDIEKFTEESLRDFFIQLCDLIDMERTDVYFWEERESTEPHIKGISAIQFIRTSNITIHTLDITKTVYINLFSCKEFDADKASEFILTWFGGRAINNLCFYRGLQG